MPTFAEILKPTSENIKKVSDVLLSGDVVALPTETVYGLAGIINDDAALRKIFEVKSRPFFDPLIVHVLGLSVLLNLVEVTEKTRNQLSKLTDAFSPGPLTFILNKKKTISDLVTAGKKTVAIRIPAHPVFREVLHLAGPLAAPSANPFGYVSPTKPEHVLQSLGTKIRYILDGGSCSVGVESTILDMSQKNLTILRPGAITKEMIEDTLHEPVVPYRSMVSTDPSAPGMLKQHYSPKTRLRLFRYAEDLDTLQKKFEVSRVAVVALSKFDDFLKIFSNNSVDAKFFSLSKDGNLGEVMRNMFDLLQQLDAMGFEIIYFQVPEKSGLGIAINDRLERAAAKFRS